MKPLFTLKHVSNNEIWIKPPMSRKRMEYALGETPPRYPLPMIPISAELFAPDSMVAFAIWYLEPLINPES